MQVIYDGTMDGLLTAVFDFFENKISEAHLVHEFAYQPQMFDTAYSVSTDLEKSKRVWEGLTSIIPKDWKRRIWCAYLSEDAYTHQSLFQFIIRIFQNKNVAIWNNYGDNLVTDIALMAKKVEREKHRMKAFIRFEKSDDGRYYSLIEPDYNVIPLITSFFKDRYADQHWLIYDVRRDYGVMYDIGEMIEVKLDKEITTALPTTAIGIDTEESAYSELWRTYFKHTNIPARKNMKLHIQHVPKRYWRYLTEKRDMLFG